MELEQVTELVNGIVAVKRRTDRVLHDLSAALGAVPGTVADALGLGIDQCIKATAAGTDLTVESLEWFVYDNDCGKQGNECITPSGQIKRITCVADFLMFEAISTAEAQEGPA